MSISSKTLNFLLSMSKTAMTLPSLNTDITISDLLSGLQAICFRNS